MISRWWARPSVHLRAGKSSPPRGYLSDVLALTAQIQAVDRALALSSKLFVAIIPLSIIVSGLQPRYGRFGESLVRTLHLTGPGARATETLFATRGEIRGGIGIVATLVVLFSMLGYARSLQRLYLDVWGIGWVGLERWWRRALWTAGYTAYLGLAPPLRALERAAGLRGWYAITPLALGFALALWGPWALVGSRIPWRRLLPTTAATAMGVGLLLLLSAVFAPPVFTAAAQRYGAIGVACSMVTWLFLEALVIVMAAVVTVARDRRRHGPPIDRVARFTAKRLGGDTSNTTSSPSDSTPIASS